MQLAQDAAQATLATWHLAHYQKKKSPPVSYYKQTATQYIY